MDNNKKKATSAFSKALVTKGDAEKKGGLLSVLGNKPAIQGPQKSSFNDVQKAVETSAENNAKYESVDICFVIDATASRESTWLEAQKIQALMFHEIRNANAKSKLGVVVYRGGNTETLGWFDNAHDAERTMQPIDCERGVTRIKHSLENAAVGHTGQAPKSMILIGDTSEENFSDIDEIAHTLAARGITVHAFLEGYSEQGEKAFKHLAEITGGFFKSFRNGMELSDLCSVIAAYDTGGKEAFDKLLAKGHGGALALKEYVEKKKQLGMGR